MVVVVPPNVTSTSPHTVYTLRLLDSFFFDLVLERRLRDPFLVEDEGTAAGFLLYSGNSRENLHILFNGHCPHKGRRVWQNTSPIAMKLT